MFATSLVLLAALAVQDGAAPAVAPAPEAPAQTPAETPAAVLRMLESADARMYDPADHGLQQLQFVFPVALPTFFVSGMAAQMGLDVGALEGDTIEVGSVAVDWTKEGGADFQAEKSAGVPDAVTKVMTAVGLTEEQFPAMADQGLRNSMNQLVSFQTLLETHVGALGESDGELVHVVFSPLPGTPEGIPSIDWYFDEDDVPVKSVVVFDQATQMGPMEVTVTLNHTWTPVGTDQLLIHTVSMTQDMPMMSTSQDTVFDFTMVNELPVLLGYTETTSQMGQTMTKETKFTDVKVNGEAVPAS